MMMSNGKFSKECEIISMRTNKSIPYFFIYYNFLPMTTQKNGLYIFEGLTQKEIAYFIMMSEMLSFKKGTTIMSE